MTESDEERIRLGEAPYNPHSDESRRAMKNYGYAGADGHDAIHGGSANAVIFLVGTALVAPPLVAGLVWNAEMAEYVTTLDAFLLVGNSAIYGVKRLAQVFTDPVHNTKINWTAAAAALVTTVGIWSAIESPGDRRQKELAAERERMAAAWQRDQEAALQRDPRRPEYARQMNDFFKRPFSKMYGTHTMGNLCKAFDYSWRVSCDEDNGGALLWTPMQGKTTGAQYNWVHIQNRSTFLTWQSPSILTLETRKDMNGEVIDSIEIRAHHNPNTSYDLGKYDSALTEPMMKALERMGIGKTIVASCTAGGDHSPRDIEMTIPGGRLSCGKYGFGSDKVVKSLYFKIKRPGAPVL